MQVLKFGGSSVGSAEAIAKVVAIVTEAIKKEPTIDGQPSSQILQTSSSGESCDAVSKES